MKVELESLYIYIYNYIHIYVCVNIYVYIQLHTYFPEFSLCSVLQSFYAAFSDSPAARAVGRSKRNPTRWHGFLPEAQF